MAKLILRFCPMCGTGQTRAISTNSPTLSRSPINPSRLTSARSRCFSSFEEVCLQPWHAHVACQCQGRRMRTPAYLGLALGSFVGPEPFAESSHVFGRSCF